MAGQSVYASVSLSDDFEDHVESLNPIDYLDIFTLEDEDDYKEIEQLLTGLFPYLKIFNAQTSFCRKFFRLCYCQKLCPKFNTKNQKHPFKSADCGQ